ncbi:hypothetical protein Goklo_020502, partial [Gossypium klotzschianum]|nr:hypothetical protein [Gossypium klotzschianum]
AELNRSKKTVKHGLNQEENGGRKIVSYKVTLVGGEFGNYEQWLNEEEAASKEMDPEGMETEPGGEHQLKRGYLNLPHSRGIYENP